MHVSCLRCLVPHLLALDDIVSNPLCLLAIACVYCHGAFTALLNMLDMMLNRRN